MNDPTAKETASSSEAESVSRSGSQPGPLFSWRVLFVACGASLGIAITVLVVSGFDDSDGVISSAVVLVPLLVFLGGMFVRNRFRISLRTLLILTTILAFVCGYIAREIVRVRSERIALTYLLSGGGSVSFSHDVAVSRSKWTYTPAGVPIPKWFMSLCGDSYHGKIDRLQCGGWSHKGEIVDLLGELEDVRHLDLSNDFSTTADEFTRLPLFPGLRSLHVKPRHLSNAGIDRLKQLPLLRSLQVSGDYELIEGELSQLTQIEELVLDHDHLNKIGYREIANMPSLRNLRIAGYAGTNWERDFRQTRPDVMVNGS